MSSKQTRQRLLTVAWRLMREAPARASMEKIATAAGVSRQAVYLHFGNRAGLLLALVRWIDKEEGIVQQFATLDSSCGPRATLQAMICLWLNYLVRLHPVPAYLAHARRDAAAQRAWKDRMALMENLYREPLSAMYCRGELRHGLSVEQAVDIVRSIASIFSWEHLVEERSWETEQATTTLWQAVAGALGLSVDG